MRFIQCGLLLTCSLAWGDVYKWTDSQGKVHFSDKPGNQAAEPVKIEIINTYTESHYSPIKTALEKNKVVMFSASWCQYCKKANNFFKANNIAFVEMDIEKDQEAKFYFDSIGGKGLPVILYKNKKLTGFSEEKFKEFYK